MTTEAGEIPTAPLSTRLPSNTTHVGKTPVQANEQIKQQSPGLEPSPLDPAAAVAVAAERPPTGVDLDLTPVSVSFLPLELPLLGLRERAQVLSPPSVRGRSSATQSPRIASGAGLMGALLLLLPACASALLWTVDFARIFSKR